jgi:hypothetical protein
VADSHPQRSIRADRRRHNRAATSLDAKLRDEAAIMLDAIAAVKEKLPPS